MPLVCERGVNGSAASCQPSTHFQIPKLILAHCRLLQVSKALAWSRLPSSQIYHLAPVEHSQSSPQFWCGSRSRSLGGGPAEFQRLCFPQDNLQGIRREVRPGSALPPRPEEEGPGAFFQPVHSYSQKEGQGKQDKATENEIKATETGNKDTSPGCGCGKGFRGRMKRSGSNSTTRSGGSRGKTASKRSLWAIRWIWEGCSAGMGRIFCSQRINVSY